MNEQSDLEAVRKCLQGEADAFEDIIRRYQKQVLSLAYRIVQNTEDARDIAQSVFIKAYGSLASFDPQFKLFSWLYRIAVNESLNFVEKRDRRGLSGPAWAAEAADPADELAAGELRRRVEHAVGRLAPAQRAILALSADGLSYREIGQTLRLPEQRVKSRLFAARDKLRGLMGREGRPAHDR